MLVLSEKSHEEQNISEIVAIALTFVECIVVWIIYICMYLAVDQTLAIYVMIDRNLNLKSAILLSIACRFSVVIAKE